MPESPSSPINNLSSVECQPWVRGWSGVWKSIEQRSVRLWVDDSKWLTKWVVVRNGKIYLGTYTENADGSHYINFKDNSFDLMDQKDKTKLLGFQVNLVNNPENVRFTTLKLDATKGTLSIFVKDSNWTDQNAGGYNEIYTCKEVALDTLNENLQGLPKF